MSRLNLRNGLPVAIALAVMAGCGGASDEEQYLDYVRAKGGFDLNAKTEAESLARAHAICGTLEQGGSVLTIATRIAEMSKGDDRMLEFLTTEEVGAVTYLCPSQKDKLS